MEGAGGVRPPHEWELAMSPRVSSCGCCLLVLAVGSCHPAGGTATVTPPHYEDPCATDTDCSNGFICVERNESDGTLVCRMPCNGDAQNTAAECPLDWCANCEPVGGGRATCRIVGCS